MYVHPAFKIDTAEAIVHLRQRAFGLLVLPTPDAPTASHVPFLVDEQPNGMVRIELHVARANKLHTHVGAGCKALLVCQGPDAYISPDWYFVANQVPTWTYTTVHVAGTAMVLPEADTLAHVDRLSGYFEQRLLPKKPWTSAKMDTARRDAMLKAIVSIAIDVESIEAQKKLIQHKGETEHRGVIAGLRSRDDAGSQAIAALMEQTASLKFGR
jgi:transcriptional regulator